MAEVDKSEKITINVGLVNLGQIDLLVDEGFYANRTDFIRTALRRQLESRAEAVSDTVARRALVLGTQHLSRRDLEELRSTGQTVELHVLGLATIANDVSPELALATIASVEVLGAFRAPPAVKATLASRTTSCVTTAPTDRSTSTSQPEGGSHG
jgi:Arc/MetJ-type ribon-helix-helix transcriptional regulator